LFCGRGEDPFQSQASGAPADVTGIAGLVQIRSQLFVGDEAFVFQQLQQGALLGFQILKR